MFFLHCSAFLEFSKTKLKKKHKVNHKLTSIHSVWFSTCFIIAFNYTVHIIITCIWEKKIFIVTSNHVCKYLSLFLSQTGLFSEYLFVRRSFIIETDIIMFRLYALVIDKAMKILIWKCCLHISTHTKCMICLKLLLVALCS